ncbi:MAG: protein kinase, partial [Pseudomonadota bacterium]
MTETSSDTGERREAVEAEPDRTVIMPSDDAAETPDRTSPAETSAPPSPDRTVIAIPDEDEADAPAAQATAAPDRTVISSADDAPDQTVFTEVPAPTPPDSAVISAEPTPDRTVIAGDDADQTQLSAPPAETTAGDEGDLGTDPGGAKPDAPDAPSDGTAIPAALPPAARSAPKGRRLSVEPGTIINNNYEIQSRINAGGMGEVYRGRNVHTDDQVAIKIVLDDLAHKDQIRALFLREANTLCKLTHPEIVRYFNFLHDQDLDRYCLVMEFIEGVPLSEWIQRNGPLKFGDAKRLLRRLAGGLEKAHRMEVIHRDLSPDNVMLRDGKVEEAVLIDFGIAKSAEKTDASLHGQLAGKFKFISPEQLGHYDGIVGPWTDVYGLALLIAAAVRG